MKQTQKLAFVFGLALTLAAPLASFASSSLDAKGLASVLNSPQLKEKVGNKSIEKIEITSENGASGKSVSHTLRLSLSEAGLGPSGASTHPCILEARLEEIYTVEGIDSVLLVNDPICAMNSIPSQGHPRR